MNEPASSLAFQMLKIALPFRVAKRGSGGKRQVDTTTAGTEWGTGGMATKLTAARLATAAGCRMVICSSAVPESIPHAVNGRHTGTLFHPHPTALRQACYPSHPSPLPSSDSQDMADSLSCAHP